MEDPGRHDGRGGPDADVGGGHPGHEDVITFEDHVAGVNEVKQKVQLWAGVAAAAAVVGGLVLYARL